MMCIGPCEVAGCPLPAVWMLMDASMVCEGHAPTPDEEARTLAVLREYHVQMTGETDPELNPWQSRS